jgi:hypothetical protein
LLLVGQHSHSRVRRLYLSDFPFHGDGLALLADRESKIDDGLGAYGQSDTAAHHRGKPRLAGLDIVAADGKVGEVESSGAVASGGSHGPGSGVLHLNGCTRNGRAGLVCDRAQNAAGSRLRC